MHPFEALKKQKIEMNNLRMEVKKHKFGLERFSGSDDDIRFYTGFPNYSTFKSFYDFLLPAATQLNYWGSMYSDSRDEPKRGPQRKIQLFMVLYRLRCDALEKDIADRFGVSVSTVSRTLNTWINFLYHTLKQLPIWPSAKVIKDTMPKCCFKEQYPKTRVRFSFSIHMMYELNFCKQCRSFVCSIFRLMPLLWLFSASFVLRNFLQSKFFIV